MKQTLILIRGIPGSGKSAIATAFAERVGRESVCVLDPDLIDTTQSEYSTFTRDLKDAGVDERFFPYRYLRSQAHDAIKQGQHVVWNQAFTDLSGLQKTVDNLTSYASDNGVELVVVIVEVNIDSAVARKRIDDRTRAGGHGVNEERFRKFLEDYRSFANEGFSVIQVSGEDPTEASVDHILHVLS